LCIEEKKRGIQVSEEKGPQIPIQGHVLGRGFSVHGDDPAFPSKERKEGRTRRVGVGMT